MFLLAAVTVVAAALRLEDLVVATPSHTQRLPLLQAARAWRFGIETLIVVNGTMQHGSAMFHETLLALDDRDFVFNHTKLVPLKEGQHGEPTKVVVKHKGLPGHIRAAITPMLAHAHFTQKGRDYKWMLYGDDDTLFYIPNAIKLLERLDPSVPMALTDNLW